MKTLLCKDPTILKIPAQKFLNASAGMVFSALCLNWCEQVMLCSPSPTEAQVKYPQLLVGHSSALEPVEIVAG